MSEHYRAPIADLSTPVEHGDARLLALSGRLGRARYIAYGIAAGLPFAIVNAALTIGAEGDEPSGAGAMLLLLLGAAVLVATVVLSVRRCNDFNVTGWLSIISLVPLLNLLLWLIPGTRGPNRFGPPPPPNSTFILVVAWIFPVLFLVGIVAAVALPAYNEYVDLANEAREAQQSMTE